jgi:hypothetical protein
VLEGLLLKLDEFHALVQTVRLLAFSHPELVRDLKRECAERAVICGQHRYPTPQ